jgi:DNA polymerase III delta prime subunit
LNHLEADVQEFDLSPPSKKVVAEHIDNILTTEGIEHSVEDVVTIIKKFYPDFRKIINNCQKYTVDNVLTLDKSIDSTDDYKEKVVVELKTPSSKSFNNIRQIVANTDLDDFGDLYRFLYDQLGEYAKGNEGMIIIILEEYLYHSTFRLDKEINLMACISKILETISNKKII